MNVLLASIAACLFCTVNAMLSTQSRDEKLQHCFSREAYLKRNGTTDPECVTFFLDITLEFKGDNNFTDAQINYLRSLDRQGRKLLIESKRGKRQSRRRLRRECRTLSATERRSLFGAIQRLKRESPNGPLDDYDTLAALHRPMANIQNAHGGSNFLGWHRVYLFYYENALVRKDPSVSLCYWDSTLDFLMPGATQRQTVVFSDALFGNGNGAVINGPFAEWPLAPPLIGTLRRGIGINGSLTRPGIVDLIARDPRIFRHSHILQGQNAGFTDPDTFRRHSLEAEHGNAHVWVGEVMSDVPNAAQDPVFYFHHCYIDYVWELFRIKQRTNFNIDPANDYPVHGNPFWHGPNVPMRGFFEINPFWINRRGYLNEFTNLVYRYARHPTCGNNCGGSTEFLRCTARNPRRNPTARCVSREATTDRLPAGQVQMFGSGDPGFPGGDTAFAARTVAEREGPLNLSGFRFRSTFNDPRIQA